MQWLIRAMWKIHIENILLRTCSNFGIWQLISGFCSDLPIYKKNIYATILTGGREDGTYIKITT